MRVFFLVTLILLSRTEDRESRLFRFSLEQGYDDSCGFQALAALLSLYWGVATTEGELVEECFSWEGRGGGYEASFADMLRLLSSRGFLAAAFEMSYEDLVGAAALYAPILGHFSSPSRHFTLILFADAEGVVLADPAAGTYYLERRDFLSRWSGHVLLASLPGESLKGEVLRAAVAEVKSFQNILMASLRFGLR